MVGLFSPVQSPDSERGEKRRRSSSDREVENSCELRIAPLPIQNIGKIH